MLVHARGARKPKSKFLACAQVFTYGDYVLAEGRGFRSVTQAEIIESFYNLRCDYDRLVAAHMIVEVCEKSLLEDVSADGLLQLVLKALSHLAKGAYPPLQVSGVFLLRFFLWYGLAPQTEYCCVCEVPLEEMASIRFANEGVRCAGHNSGLEEVTAALTITNSAALALRHVFTSSLSQSFSFKASEAVISELQRMGRVLLNSHFDWRLK